MAEKDTPIFATTKTHDVTGIRNHGSGHISADNLRSRLMAVGLTVMGVLSDQSEEVYGGEVSRDHTMSSSSSLIEQAHDVHDQSGEAFYHLPWSTREVSNRNPTEIYSIPERKSADIVPFARDGVRTPTASTLSGAIQEFGLENSSLQYAGVDGPRTPIRVGNTVQFRSIMAFRQRNNQTIILDITRYTQWRDGGGLAHLRNGMYYNDGRSRGGSYSLAPEFYYSHGSTYIRALQGAYFMIEGYSPLSRRTQSIASTLEAGAQETLSIKHGSRTHAIPNVIIGSHQTFQLLTQAYDRSGNLCSQRINPETIYALEPNNGVLPNWITHLGGGKFFIGKIDKPSVARIVSRHGGLNAWNQVVCIPEPLVQSLHVICPSGVTEGETIPFRVIAHYPDGWTPRDVTDRARFVWGHRIIEMGSMGHEPYMHTPDIRSRQSAEIQVAVQQFDSAHLIRSSNETEKMLCEFTQMQNVSVTIEAISDMNEFRQVKLPNGMIEYVPLDLNPSPSRQLTPYTDTRTSDLATQLTDDVSSDATPMCIYGGAVNQTRLGIQLRNQTMIAGQSDVPIIYYQYKDTAPIDVTRHLRIQTDCPSLLIRGTTMTVDPNISAETTAHIWVTSTVQGRQITTGKRALKLVPIEFGISTQHDTVRVGDKLPIQAYVRAGNFENHDISHLVTWRVPVGDIVGGVYTASESPDKEMRITIHGSLRYAGREYASSVSILIQPSVPTSSISVSPSLSPQIPASSQGDIEHSPEKGGTHPDEIMMTETKQSIARVRDMFQSRISDPQAYASGYALWNSRVSDFCLDTVSEISIRAGALMLLSVTHDSQEKNKSAISHLIGEAMAILDTFRDSLSYETIPEALLASYEMLHGPGSTVAGFLQNDAEFFQASWMLAMSVPGVEARDVLMHTSADTIPITQVLLDEIRRDIVRYYPSDNFPIQTSVTDSLQQGTYRPAGYEAFDLVWAVSYHDTGVQSIPADYPAQLSLSFRLGGRKYTIENIKVVSDIHKQTIVTYMNSKLTGVYAQMDEIRANTVTKFPEQIQNFLAKTMGIEKHTHGATFDTTLYADDQITPEITTLTTPGKISSHHHPLGYIVSVQYRNNLDDPSVNYPASMWIEVPLEGNNRFQSERITVNNFDHKQAVANYFEVIYPMWETELLALSDALDIDVLRRYTKLTDNVFASNQYEESSWQSFNTDPTRATLVPIWLGSKSTEFTGYSPIDSMQFIVNGERKTLSAYPALNETGEYEPYLERTVDDYGAKHWGHQCTQLIYRYLYEIYDVPKSTHGHGKNVAESVASRYPELFEVHLNALSETPPSIGSIVSMDAPGAYGHVSIVKGVYSHPDNPNQLLVSLMEQNFHQGSGYTRNRQLVFKKDSTGKWECSYKSSNNAYVVIGWSKPR